MVDNKIKVLINVLNYLIQNNVDFELKNNNIIKCKKFKLGIYSNSIELFTTTYHLDFKFDFNVCPNEVLNTVIKVLDSQY